MKQIKKIALSKPVEKELSEKQKLINSGKVRPDFNLSGELRKEVRSKLFKAQKYLCAYCEQLIDEQNYHIEHFFEQHDFPNRIYDYYHNFLASCQGDIQPLTKGETWEEKQERLRNISCGHKKTRAYHKNTELEYQMLLNPHDNINKYISYTDGYIRPSEICNQEQKQKVQYTAKRLNLSSQKLNNRRINAINEILSQMELLSDNEVNEYITDLLDVNQERMPAFHSTLADNFGFLR